MNGSPAVACKGERLLAVISKPFCAWRAFALPSSLLYCQGCLCTLLAKLQLLEKERRGASAAWKQQRLQKWLQTERWAYEHKD